MAELMRSTRMIDDRPPDELLDACLYAIDIKLAAVRALLAELRSVDDLSQSSVLPADVMAAHIREIETFIEDAIAA